MEWCASIPIEFVMKANSPQHRRLNAGGFANVLRIIIFDSHDSNFEFALLVGGAHTMHG